MKTNDSQRSDASPVVVPAAVLSQLHEDGHLPGYDDEKKESSEKSTENTQGKDVKRTRFSKREHALGSESNRERDIVKLSLPDCELPPSDVLGPVETFVAKAVFEQHQNADDDNMPAILQYRAILEAFRSRSDYEMLWKLLIALRTSGRGETLNLLTKGAGFDGGGGKHPRLIHQILRMYPFGLYELLQKNALELSGEDDGDEKQPPPEEEDYRVADAYFHLLIDIATVNPNYMGQIMMTVWNHLTDFNTLKSQGYGSSCPPERLQRFHATLAILASRLPLGGSSVLAKIVSDKPPHFHSEEKHMIYYYKQCITLADYLPRLKGKVWEMIIDTCIDMDVEIRIKDNGDVSLENAAALEQRTAQLNADEDSKALDTKPIDKRICALANKLDSLMLLLMEEDEKLVFSKQEHPLRVVHQLYHVLSEIFEELILLTHKSKFVQFLILHVCGLEVEVLKNEAATEDEKDSSLVEQPILYRKFVTTLIEILVDPKCAIVTQQSAACYIASFVSRASYVCTETVCEAISVLLRWAETYILAHEQNLKDPYHSVHTIADSREQCRRHRLFYTVCQATFYMMCFRGAEAVQFYQETIEGLDKIYVERINISPERWNALCSHSLQPLRYCLESVRFEFIHLSRHHHLLSEQLLAQLTADEERRALGLKRLNEVRQRRLSRQWRKSANSVKINTPAHSEKERVSGGVGGLGQGTNPLDSFFPFDPYLLQKSHDYVEPFYRHWSGMTVDKSDDEDGEEKEMVENEEEDDMMGDDNLSLPEEDNNHYMSSDDESQQDSDVDHGRYRGFSIESAGAQPMSFTSQVSGMAGYEAHRREALDATGNDVIVFQSDDHRDMVMDMLHRDRAASIEDGSW